MSPGTLLFDSEFTFHDGDTGRKILITLGTDRGLTVVAKTTSRGNRYGISYGCQSSNRFPSFHLPRGCCCLSEPTWICLDEFYEFKDTTLMQRCFSGVMNRLGMLPDEITMQLLECTAQCDDISTFQGQIVLTARATMGDVAQ